MRAVSFLFAIFLPRWALAWDAGLCPAALCFRRAVVFSLLPFFFLAMVRLYIHRFSQRSPLTGARKRGPRKCVDGLEEFGRLDFAANNAGVSPWTGNTVDCTFETWQRGIGVNLTGTWFAAAAHGCAPMRRPT